jgi:hypothetical protein
MSVTGDGATSGGCRSRPEQAHGHLAAIEDGRRQHRRGDDARVPIGGAAIHHGLGDVSVRHCVRDVSVRHDIARLIGRAVHAPVVWPIGGNVHTAASFESLSLEQAPNVPNTDTEQISHRVIQALVIRPPPPRIYARVSSVHKAFSA